MKDWQQRATALLDIAVKLLEAYDAPKTPSAMRTWKSSVKDFAANVAAMKCRHKEPFPFLDYGDFELDALKRKKRGDKQRHCKSCGRWIWDSEWFKNKKP